MPSMIELALLPTLPFDLVWSDERKAKFEEKNLETVLRQIG